MILIADSGSTKTEWALLRNGVNLKTFITEGFNPYFQTEEVILNNIKNQTIIELGGINLSEIKFVFFYGAGCSNETNINLIKRPLQHFFANAKIEVEHDLLAAARACCGNEDGIAAILGTGSNSCLFVNGEIKDQIPSLGLFLGDEGSGGHIGKLFISNFFYRNFSKRTSDKIQQDLKLNKDEVLENVYKKPFPNRYLAGFTKYIAENINNPEVESIVIKAFDTFIESTVKKYPEQYNLSTVGSVGFYFNDQLKKSTLKYNIRLNKTIKNPMEGLIQYHQNAH